MKSSELNTFIYVMDSDTTASWHQVIGPLRAWHRKKLVDAVAQTAEALGYDSYAIFDAHESLQAEGTLEEKVD